jgi:bifunctional DNase/RNase
MDKLELEIVALSHSVTQSHNYAVVLGEKGGERRLPIVIGGFEAQAIAVAMEDMNPSRPLTHDLFKNALETFEIDLQEVVINNLLDGIFFARLVCNVDGKIVEIDSRTSDAIAMAVRFKCPIYTYKEVLDEAGVTLSDEGSTGKESTSGSTSVKATDSLESLPLSGLEELLDKMLAEENYEKAADIRDEMNRRKGEGGEN